MTNANVWGMAKKPKRISNALYQADLLRLQNCFSVPDAEQLKRFRARLSDPVSQWKLSPMDLESISRWEDYSRAKDKMMAHTDTPFSPWYVVESDIKKHARLNMMAHLLSTIPYTPAPAPRVELPERLTPTTGYERPPRELATYVPDHAAKLLAEEGKAT